MFGSAQNPCDTDPVVAGGVYEFVHPDGRIEQALMTGVMRHPAQISGKPGTIEGNLFTFARGNIPYRVVENTESLKGWTLVLAPTKSAADYLHNAKTSSDKTAKVAKAAKAAKGTRVVKTAETDQPAV